MPIPQQDFDLVKCSLCDKFLSYFPINMNKNNEPVCGRCSKILTKTYLIRATFFEKIAQYLKFPCIYCTEGCVESLTPNEVPDHEENCPYKLISCPNECVWQGKISVLLDHFEQVHPTLILRDCLFEINCIHSYEICNLVVFNNKLFNFKRKFDSAKRILRCSVSCYKMLNSANEYNYEITFENGNKNKVLNSETVGNILKENFVVVDMENVRKILNNPPIITGKIRIFKTIEALSVEKQVNPEIQHDVLAELECPVCLNFITPPIYQCSAGHSICISCKEQVPQCPICRKPIGTTHNVTLEKMANRLIYPCPNSEKGCVFADKPERIEQHKKYCNFGTRHCPLKNYEHCNWKGIEKEIDHHLQNFHRYNILERDTVRIFIGSNYFNYQANLYYIIKYLDAMFLLHYRYEDSKFYWEMQLIGPPEQSRNYKFEIDICDNNHNNQKLFLRNFCTNFKEKDECFTYPDQYVFLTLDQIRSFLSDMFTFRVRIVT